MDNSENLKLLKEGFKGNPYEMQSPKPFNTELRKIPPVNESDAQTDNSVKRYDCPNCQGCGCTTCGGFGYLEY